MLTSRDQACHQDKEKQSHWKRDEDRPQNWSDDELHFVCRAAVQVCGQLEDTPRLMLGRSKAQSRPKASWGVALFKQTSKANMYWLWP